MSDETESAVAAWLDDAGTQREVAIARKRLALLGGDPSHAWVLALLIEILANLNVYGDPTNPDGEAVIEFPDEDDDMEPWQRKAS